MFQLTPQGNATAEQVTDRNDTETRIIGHLYEVAKPVELENIQDFARLSDEATIRILKRMVSEGLVEEV